MSETQKRRKAVKQALHKYYLIEPRIKVIQQEIAFKEKEMELIAAPTSQYKEGSRGTAQSSQVEGLAERRAAIRQEINNLRIELDHLALKRVRVDAALQYLRPDPLKMIKAKFFEGKTYMEIGLDFCYSEKWARVNIAKILDEMALMMGF